VTGPAELPPCGQAEGETYVAPADVARWLETLRGTPARDELEGLAQELEAVFGLAPGWRP
jgi:hypothetical protein